MTVFKHCFVESWDREKKEMVYHRHLTFPNPVPQGEHYLNLFSETGFSVEREYKKFR